MIITVSHTDATKGDSFQVKQRQGQVPNATWGRGWLKENRDKDTLLIWDGLLERSWVAL